VRGIGISQEGWHNLHANPINKTIADKESLLPHDFGLLI
jgi:hypothetical protein